MRSNVLDYDLVAPPTLPAVLEALAADPGRYTPIAGGTELMYFEIPMEKYLSAPEAKRP